jgi:hypothetical protein
MPFGDFMMSLGGSLNQLIVPGVLTVVPPASSRTSGERGMIRVPRAPRRR